MSSKFKFLKIISRIIYLGIIGFVLWHAFDTYEAIEKQNMLLLKQKVHYEAILSLDPIDIQEKEKIYSIIKEKEQEYASLALDINLSPALYIIILMVLLSIANYIYDSLNEKFEKTKDKTVDDANPVQ